MRLAALPLALLALAACSKPPAPATAETAPAPANAWVVDAGASRLSFTATQTGESFTGAFKSWSAEIVFDPEALGDAAITVSVDTGSGETGDRQRDAALPGSDWFASRDYPAATFASDDVVSTGPGEYEARGALTIRDVKRPLVLPFTLTIEGDRAHAEGSVTLVRTDFGVGGGEFATDQWVGLDVGVSFVIEATKPQ